MLDMVRFLEPVRWLAALMLGQAVCSEELAQRARPSRNADDELPSPPKRSLHREVEDLRIEHARMVDDLARAVRFGRSADLDRLSQKLKDKELELAAHQRSRARDEILRKQGGDQSTDRAASVATAVASALKAPRYDAEARQSIYEETVRDLLHPDPNVRADAVRLLAGINAQSDVDLLCALALYDSDHAVKLAALDALARTGSRAAHVTLERFRHGSDLQLRAAATRGLSRWARRWSVLSQAMK